MRITPIQQIVFTGRPEDSNKRSKIYEQYRKYAPLVKSTYKTHF